MLQYCLDNYPIVSYTLIIIFLVILIPLNSVPRETYSDQEQRREERILLALRFLYDKFLSLLPSKNFKKNSETKLQLIPSFPNTQKCQQNLSDQWSKYLTWQLSQPDSQAPLLDHPSQVEHQSAENTGQLTQRQVDSGIFLDSSFDLKPEPEKNVRKDISSHSDDSLFYDKNSFDSIADHLIHLLIQHPMAQRRFPNDEHVHSLLFSDIPEIISTPNSEAAPTFNDESLFFDNDIFDSYIAKYIIKPFNRKRCNLYQKYIHAAQFSNCLKELLATHRTLPDYKSDFCWNRKLHMIRFDPVLECIRARLTRHTIKKRVTKTFDEDSLFFGDNQFVSIPDTFKLYLLGKQNPRRPLDFDLQYHQFKLSESLKLISSKSKDDQVKLSPEPPMPTITKDNVLETVPLPIYIPLKLSERLFDVSTTIVAKSLSLLFKPLL